MAKTNAIILGAGMVGSVMAADLAADENFNVTIADLSQDALERAVRAAQPRASAARLLAIDAHVADLSDPATVKELIAPHDIVLGALASTIGFQTLKAVIEAGKPYCDISFMPENALDLDALAKSRNVTAIVDCGVAPGMSNLLAGYGAAQLDRCDRIEIYVGGIPREPKPPFFYKAAFSPADVIEEYTRPARFVEDGEIVTREALSEPEMLDFPEVGNGGALEAFNTDGLRSIMFTMNAPNMKEKTLRWPGHIDLMRVFRETGLFSKEPIKVPLVASRERPDSGRLETCEDARDSAPSREAASGDSPNSREAASGVRPLDLTSALLFPKWTYEEGEDDLTIMRIIVAGEKEGVRTQLTWDLHDARDRATGFTSMARTTAFPCTILARMLARGEISPGIGPGVIVPEMLGPMPGLAQRVLRELSSRGVAFTARRSPAE